MWDTQVAVVVGVSATAVARVAGAGIPGGVYGSWGLEGYELRGGLGWKTCEWPGLRTPGGSWVPAHAP